MHKSANLNKTRKYRYVLSRQWGDSADNFVNFVLLNPSTADENSDDQTIRRCINLTRSWGYDGIYVTNLFAFRTRHPSILFHAVAPVGKENDKYLIRFAKEAKIVIIAWGNNGNFLHRDEDVIKLLSPIKQLYQLGKSTIHGQPRHPLMIRRATKPEKYFMQ